MQYTTTQPFEYGHAAEDLNADVSRVALFDADGDGDLDVIVGDALYPVEDRSVPVLLLLNDGAGGLSDGTEALFGATIPELNGPLQILTGDYDGDERDDVFIGSFGPDGEPWSGSRNSLYLSASGEGLVDASDTLPEVSDATYTATQGDIDGDGDIDIVVINVAGGTPPSGPLTDCYVLLNDGAGEFTRTDDRLPPDIEVRTFGTKFGASLLFDADGDDDLDLFLGPSGEPVEEHSLLLMNDGSGDFSAAERRQLPDSALGAVGVNANDAVAADLDGDGALDLVLARALNYRGNHIQILMNDGAGVFADQTATRLPQVFDESGPYTSAIGVADMNGDGFLDLVALHFVYPPIFLNDGTGHFINLPHTGFDYSGVEGPPEALRLMPVDANRDGRMDLLAIEHAGQQTDSYWFYLQQDPGLSIAGSDAADGLTGDADAESIIGGGGDDVLFGAAGGDTVSGGLGADYLNGGDGRDRLLGGAGADELSGFHGADTLDGGAGADLLRGGLGDDTYVVDSGDVLQEFKGQGTDTVQSRGGFTLGEYIEHLQLTGGANAAGVGNALANAIRGNSGANRLDGQAGNDQLLGGLGADLLTGGPGADTLSGGAGVDTLAGGLGADVFVFDSAATAGNADTIRDFASGLDVLRLAAGRFAGLAPGVLAESQFVSGAGSNVALEADDRIVYDSASGALYYDVDGAGGVAAVQFAQLGSSAHPVLVAADFLVV